MSFTRRCVTGAIVGLLVTTIFPASPAQAACYRPTRTEKSFIRKMNAARADAGKSALTLDIEMSKVSKVHTKEMVNAGSLFHTSSSTLGRRVTNWVLLGENVGVGATVKSLHAAFMGSTAHRANILLSSFRYVGVGAKKSGDRLWVTVTFEAKSNPGSPLC